MSRWESSLPIQEEIPLHFEFIVVTVSNSSGLLTGSFFSVANGCYHQIAFKRQKIEKTLNDPTPPRQSKPGNNKWFPYLSLHVCILYVIFALFWSFIALLLSHKFKTDVANIRLRFAWEQKHYTRYICFFEGFLWAVETLV